MTTVTLDDALRHWGVMYSAWSPAAGFMERIIFGNYIKVGSFRAEVLNLSQFYRFHLRLKL
jgi:hypothetical protein